jgi:hypothetical protein
MVKEQVHCVYVCEVCNGKFATSEEAKRCEEQPDIMNDYGVGTLLMFQHTRQPVMVIGVEHVGHEYKHRLQYITGNEVLSGNDRNLMLADNHMIEALRSWAFKGSFP